MKGTKSQEDQWMVQNHVFRIYDIVCHLPPHAQSVKLAPYYSLQLGFHFAQYICYRNLVSEVLSVMFWHVICSFEIRRDNHIEYLTKSLKQLGPNFAVLDAKYAHSQSLIVYEVTMFENL